MKKIIVTVVLAFVFTTNGFSQLDPADAKHHVKRHHSDITPEEKAKRSLDHAAKIYGLDDGQKVKWQQAALGRANANQPLKTKMMGSTTPVERKAIHIEMQKNEDVFDEAVKGFLTEEQNTKYILQKQKHKKMRSQSKNNGGVLRSPVEQK